AVRANHTLACWGANASGQAAPPTGAFLHSSAAEAHTCAVRTDGTAACWGSPANSRRIPTNETGRFSQVSAANRHTCAVRDNDFVSCWGANDQGQLSPVTLLTTSPLQNGWARIVYQQAFSASGGSGPYTFLVEDDSALPPGLSLSTAGLLSGQVWVPGPYTFTVLVGDANFVMARAAYEVEFLAPFLSWLPAAFR
ncbi:MAG: hypothetical protein EHM21_05645, partial [Chloroflexi bacterium]